VAALEAMWPRQLPLHSGVCQQRILWSGDSLVASPVPFGVGGGSSQMGGTAWQALTGPLSLFGVRNHRANV
jgi:hypothetical protein